jgi:hypothetical protein
VQFGWAVELVWLVFGPVVFLLTGFVAAAVFFVIWHLMGSQQNYQTAFRCWAFTTPLAVVSSILGIVPYLNIIGLLLGMYFLVIASTETHGIASKRAWTVWGSICGALIILLTASEVARRYALRQGADMSVAGQDSEDDYAADEDIDKGMASPLSVSTSPVSGAAASNTPRTEKKN